MLGPRDKLREGLKLRAFHELHRGGNPSAGFRPMPVRDQADKRGEQEMLLDRLGTVDKGSGGFVWLLHTGCCNFEPSLEFNQEWGSSAVRATFQPYIGLLIPASN